MGVILLGTWSLNKCLVQPPAVTSNRNQVSARCPEPTFHLLPRGDPPPRAMHPSALLTTEA